MNAKEKHTHVLLSIALHSAVVSISRCQELRPESTLDFIKKDKKTEVQEKTIICHQHPSTPLFIQPSRKKASLPYGEKNEEVRKEESERQSRKRQT